MYVRIYVDLKQAEYTWQARPTSFLNKESGSGQLILDGTLSQAVPDSTFCSQVFSVTTNGAEQSSTPSTAPVM